MASMHDYGPGARARCGTRRRAPAMAAYSLGIAVLVAGPTFSPPRAEAAAWTRPKGNALLALPVTYTWADQAYDDSGHLVSRPRFDMFEVAPYFEYGLTDSLTIGAQPRFRSVTVDTIGGSSANSSGLAESDFFLRQNLWRRKDAAFSVQALVKAPINPRESGPAALGRDQTDAELSLMYGNRVRGDSGTFIYNVSAGYRKRWGNPDDQANANAFAGWAVSHWTFLLTSDNTIGLKSPKPGGTGVPDVLTAGPSFTQLQAGLAVAYHLSNSFSIGANGSRTYAGENVGAETSAGLSALIVW